jgi:hypothetical protein
MVLMSELKEVAGGLLYEFSHRADGGLQGKNQKTEAFLSYKPHSILTSIGTLTSALFNNQYQQRPYIARIKGKDKNAHGGNTNQSSQSQAS